MKEIIKAMKQIQPFVSRKRISKELRSLKIPTPEELDPYERISPGLAKQIIKLRSEKITAQSKNFMTLKSFLEFLLRFIRSSIMFYFIIQNIYKFSQCLFLPRSVLF